MPFEAEAEDDDVMDVDSTYGSDLQAGSEIGAAPVTDIDSLCSFGISGNTHDEHGFMESNAQYVFFSIVIKDDGITQRNYGVSDVQYK